MSAQVIQQGLKPPSNVLRYPQDQPLDAIFTPKTVAVIGATEKPGSVGRTIPWNLISSPFGGTVFPVNPNRPSILGIKAYPNIASVPEPVDLAIIVTPAPTVPGIIKECVDAGVKGAIVISAGFKESGAQGTEYEKQLIAEARRGRMRVIGPNCLGVMNPLLGLNATFASSIARPGKVAFLSQSGALCTAVLDWSFRENVGFSAFVSIGSMADVGWGDLIYYLGDNPNTSSIVIYMESVGDARSFISAAREVALTKPIIVIKAGRTAAAAQAAASHTGSLTGSDEVLDAAFRRCGVLRVESIDDLFYMAEVLGKQPQPKGSNLTIVTNAGGPGVLATDALIADGGKLTDLMPETMKALSAFLPAHWSHGNPVDVLGDADPDRYIKAVSTALQDDNTDGMLVILTPQAMTDPTRTAEKLTEISGDKSKPILASWMGGPEVEKGEELLNQASIPTFGYPDTAARTFNYMWRYAENLRGLYETPSLPEGEEKSNEIRLRAREIIERVRQSGRTILTEHESKQLLATYGIPTVETRIAANEDDAVRIANELGYPVVLKLHSETITHKTDVGGVQLNIRNADGVRTSYRAIESSVREKSSAADFKGVSVQPMIKLDGYELIIGSSNDPQFGPVLLFGMGGQLVEVFKDRSLALPPLNTTLARRMIEQTRIYTALLGVRGRAPIDLAAIEQLLVRFSYLVTEQRWIKEIDINPLLASPERLVALDARVVVYDRDVTADQLPRLAIRPYPTRYVSPWTLKDGTKVTIRPIRPEDEPLLVKFHQALSDESVYMRYFQMLRLSDRIAHERLTRICFIDYDREMALVAEHKDPETGQVSILGVGRMSRQHGRNEAELAVLITDRYQGRGLGSELWRRLIQIAREEKVERLMADILPENTDMQRVSKKLGFQVKENMEEHLIKAEMELK